MKSKKGIPNLPIDDSFRLDDYAKATTVQFFYSIKQTKNHRKKSNDIIILPYCEFLSLLLLISINQSLLHCHLLDEKDGFQFIQKSPKNIIHLGALIAILAYGIFIYKIINNKEKCKGKKYISVFFASILIFSNILFLLKGQGHLSLPYLPLFMGLCFLIILIIYRIEEHYILSTELFIDHDPIMERNQEYLDNWDQWKQSSNIETLQIFVGLLGLSVISFELIYDKVLTQTTLALYELEAPLWGHHCCLFFQVVTAAIIILTLLNENVFNIKSTVQRGWVNLKSGCSNFFHFNSRNNRSNVPLYASPCYPFPLPMDYSPSIKATNTTYTKSLSNSLSYTYMASISRRDLFVTFEECRKFTKNNTDSLYDDTSTTMSIQSNSLS